MWFCYLTPAAELQEKNSPRRITGFATPTFLRALTITPGMAATYVRLWPLISASSRTPPSEILWNFLFSASATLFARLVFPVPGGPTRSKIGDLSIIRPLAWFAAGMPKVFSCFTSLAFTSSLLAVWIFDSADSRSCSSWRFSRRTARYSRRRFLILPSP